MTLTAYAEIDEAEPEKIFVDAPEFRHKELVKTLPGVKYSAKDGGWKIPLAWTSCLALRSTFRSDLEIGKRLAIWAHEELTSRIDPALKLRTVRSLSDKIVPATDIVEMAQRTGDEMKLYPHQTAGAAFMATTRQALVGDETGTGKSAQTIGALRVLHRLGYDVFPALAVVPNTIKTTWQREFSTWWPGLQVLSVDGSAAARRKVLETPAHVYVINWETLWRHSRLARYGSTSLKRCKECGGLDERVSPANCEVHTKELNQLVFNTVIADEIHRAKAPQSKQTRALWAIGDRATFRFGLTGTPMQSQLDDLWSILRFLAPAEYPGKTAFVDRFAEIGYNVWGAMEIRGVKEEAKEEFFAAIDTRMRRMTKKAVLEFLPEIVYENRFVDMSPVQAKAYKQMEKETFAELESGETLVAGSSLAKVTRLVQFASSYAELADRELADGRIETTAKLKMPSSKVQSFVADLRAGDFGESSIVVFAVSRQLIELLSIELAKHDIAHTKIVGGQSTGEGSERQNAIDDFQSGKVKIVLVTIQAGGVGLTLTAADTMVFLQRSWSSTDMKQAESRAHRIGSEIHESVSVVNYITKGTVEERQLVMLTGKYGRIEDVVRDGKLMRAILDGEIE
jgi:SNF2 family DNA or RNA helicase